MFIYIYIFRLCISDVVFMGFMVFTLFLRTKLNYFQQFRLGTMKGNITYMIIHEVKDIIRTMNVALRCPAGPELSDESQSSALNVFPLVPVS